MADTASVLFYHGPEGLFGWLVRLFTLSRYSHVEIRVGYLSYAAIAGRGVELSVDRYFPIEQWDRIDVSIEDAPALTRWLSDEVGSRYDWPGIIFSQVLPFIRRDAATRWYCSELVCAALKRAGVLPESQRSTVSPGRLHHLLRKAIA